MSEGPVTRFAPSPSGHLHVGGARTALFCQVFARARGGRFILRIEDTDQRRSSEAASTGFLEDLAWLGIDWDEGPEYDGHGGGSNGPYRQSERLDRYRECVDRLIAEGRAYRAFETAEELDASRAAARAAKRNWRYDRAALQLTEPEIAQRLEEGRPFVVRFRVPDDAEVVVEDLVRGEVRTATSELDDFVIMKADGYPTYHLAVVADDEAMGVTHVIRAEEHLSNTPKHVLLQEALGYRRPAYAHVSIITNPDGSKMSKRDKDRALRAAVKATGRGAFAAADEATIAAWLADKDRQLDTQVAEALAAELGVHLPEIEVIDFRRAGYLPETLVNYLALLGWNPGDGTERFDRAFLHERFDMDRIVRSAAKFDRDKLLAFSLATIQEMSDEEFARRWRAHCAEFHPEFVERLDAERFAMLARANRPRSKTLEDAIPSCRFFVLDDDAIEIEDSKAVRKAMGGEPSGLSLLAALRPDLAALEEWSVAGLETMLTAWADAHAEGKIGKIAQPLRVALTGSTVSPAIFDTLAILGRESVLRRVDRCIAARAETCSP